MSLENRTFCLDPNSNGRTIELDSLLIDRKADGIRPRKGQRMNGQDTRQKERISYYGNKTLIKNRRKRDNTIFTFGHTVVRLNVMSLNRKVKQERLLSCLVISKI